MTLRGVETGVLAPVAGFLIDRRRARSLSLFGVTTAGLGVLFLSQVTNLPMFYASFFIVALGGSLGLNMVPQTLVVRWFNRNVGKATSLLTVGMGLGGLLVPLVVLLIDSLGWRTALIAIAAAILATGIPLSFVYRDRPEEYGLLPDGKPRDILDSSGGLETGASGKGVKEALKTRAFWLLGTAYMLQTAGLGVFTLHVMPYLESIDVGRTTAGLVAMLVPTISIPARLAYGWLSDIYQRKYVMAVAMFLLAVGFSLFSVVDADSWGLLVAFAIIFGLGLGGLTPLMPPMLRQHFGTRNFGTIFGLIAAFITVGGVVSPPLAGWVFDTRGTYDPVWSVLGAISLLGTALILAMPSVLSSKR